MADENYVVSLNNFTPEEFFGGTKSVSMNAPKFSNATAL